MSLPYDNEKTVATHGDDHDHDHLEPLTEEDLKAERRLLLKLDVGCDIHRARRLC